MRDVRFNDTTFSYCYHLPTTECSSDGTSGVYIQAINQTCEILDVTADQVSHKILTSYDYRGSERCGCLSPFGGQLVIVIDVNPIIVNDAIWKYRIVNTLDWFYHFMLRRSGPAIKTTYIFAHGSTYFEVSNEEIYNDFFNISINPYIVNATVSQATTKPCAAINRALTILNSVKSSNERKWLFYWGFSTPDLSTCTPYANGFAHIGTYAIRHTLSVDLSQIESIYHSFDECNWYTADETTPTQSQGIQDRAIIGTLSDFLCAKTIGLPGIVTVPPTPEPSPSPTPEPSPSPSPSPTSTTYQPTYVQPSSEPTPRHWWSSNPWSSKHHSKHHHHHHHHRRWE
jgi:hypothetical protein